MGLTSGWPRRPVVGGERWNGFVSGWRKRGFEETLNGAPRAVPPIGKLLEGKPEARIIAIRLGSPPQGDSNWTLRLLARQVVELEIIDSMSPETVRRTLQKTG